jgi:hypothetical protein
MTKHYRIFSVLLLVLIASIGLTLPASAGVAVQQPGITVSYLLNKTRVFVDERNAGETDGYRVRLSTQPTANVTVSITSDADITVSPTSLTFTPDNWNLVQIVTVTAVNDRIYEDLIEMSTILHASSSTDPAYVGLTASQTVEVQDNEFASFGIRRTGNQTGATSVLESVGTVEFVIFAVIESGGTSGTGDYGFSKPFSVGYSITGGTATLNTDYTFTAGSVSFDTTLAPSFEFTRTFSLSVADDTIDEANETIIVAPAGNETGTSGSYDERMIPSSFFGTTSHTLTITDNDEPGQPGVTVNKIAVFVTEGGTTDSYTVVLNSQPTGDVTVSIQEGGNGRMGVQVAPNTGSLTFTTANWSSPQTVTVTAVNDTLIEGAHSATLTHTATSTDTNYNGITIASLTANITDNDSAVLPNNLLSNFGFETPLGNEWVGSNLVANDRRTCNNGAFAGVCLFRFNSSAASATFRTLSQTVTASGWGAAGDTLNFAAQAQAIGYTGAMRMVIEVTYTDDTTARQRVVLPTGSYAYAQQVVSIVLTKPLASVKISFEARNDTGIMRFDNARLRLIPGAQNSAAPLALPDPQ